VCSKIASNRFPPPTSIHTRSVRQLRAEVKEARSDDYKRKYESERERSDDYKRKYESERERSDDYKRKYESERERSDDYNRKLAELKNQRSRAGGKIDALESANKNLHAELANKEDEIRRLKQQHSVYTRVDQGVAGVATRYEGGGRYAAGVFQQQHEQINGRWVASQVENAS
jgi:chromosome segregation ATPase